MLRLGPKHLAALFQPVIQRAQIRKGRHQLPHAMPRVAHILLDLPFLPSCGRVTELGIEDIMTGHRREPRIHIALLTKSNFVDGGLHIVIDAAARDAFEDAEGMPVGIKQHLMCLQQIRPHKEGAAVG